MAYLPRVLDGVLESRLAAVGAVVVEGARSLHRFRDAVDTTKTGEPAMLAVISGTGLGYLRDDGIGVIPVGSLAP